MKDSKYLKISSVNPLSLKSNKNKNKYLTQVLTNESKEKIKKYEEL